MLSVFLSHYTSDPCGYSYVYTWMGTEKKGIGFMGEEQRLPEFSASNIYSGVFYSNLKVGLFHISWETKLSVANAVCALGRHHGGQAGPQLPAAPVSV